MKNKYKTSYDVEETKIDDLEEKEVEVEKEPEPEVSNAKTISAKVCGCKQLNLREEPNGSIITTLKEDDVVEVEERGLKSKDEYVKIYTSYGATGFVMKKYLQFS